MQYIEELRAWHETADKLADEESVHACFGPRRANINALEVRIKIDPLLASIEKHLNKLTILLNPNDAWQSEEIQMVQKHQIERHKRLKEAGMKSDMGLDDARTVAERTDPKDTKMFRRLVTWNVAIQQVFIPGIEDVAGQHNLIRELLDLTHAIRDRLVERDILPKD